MEDNEKTKCAQCNNNAQQDDKLCDSCAESSSAKFDRLIDIIDCMPTRSENGICK